MPSLLRGRIALSGATLGDLFVGIVKSIYLLIRAFLISRLSLAAEVLPLDYEDKNGRDVFWVAANGSRWYLHSRPDFSLDRVWACPSPYAMAHGVESPRSTANSWGFVGNGCSQ